MGEMGLRHNSGKPKHSLISSYFLDGLARVLTFGERKYARYNWAKGLKCSEIYDSLQRHLTDWNSGVDQDPESGLPVLFHAACNLMFLTWMTHFRSDLDDRFKGEKDEIPKTKSANEPCCGLSPECGVGACYRRTVSDLASQS